MEFRIADTFTDSLAPPTGEEQKAVKTTAFDLQHADSACVFDAQMYIHVHLSIAGLAREAVMPAFYRSRRTSISCLSIPLAESTAPTSRARFPMVSHPSLNASAYAPNT